MIRCKICGEEFHFLGSHIRTHNITLEEYLRSFPRASMASRKYSNNMSLAKTGRKLSKIHRKAISEGRLGMEFSAEHKKNLSLAAVRRMEDPRQRRHASDTLKGRKLSDKRRRSMSLDMVKRWAMGVYSEVDFNHPGFGRMCYASDGHFCQSGWELDFEEWLIKNGIEHIPHPVIPGTHRRADQLIYNEYYEIDGMDRDRKYWRRKYKNGIKPIVINIYECETYNISDFFDERCSTLLKNKHFDSWMRKP